MLLVALWWLAATAVGLVAMPIALWVFRNLPGRGYAFARPLGLLLVGYLFWLGGTAGFLHNTITVDGVDEFMGCYSVDCGPIPWEIRTPLQNRWEHGENYSLFAGDYSFAPLKPVKWERRVLFVDKTYWLLQDVLTGELPKAEVGYLIDELEKQMKEAATNLEFEKAALLRDQIFELRKQLEDEDIPEWERLWKEGHPRQA